MILPGAVALVDPLREGGPLLEPEPVPPVV